MIYVIKERLDNVLSATCKCFVHVMLRNCGGKCK
jgi:hypothetical protein